MPTNNIQPDPRLINPMNTGDHQIIQPNRMIKPMNHLKFIPQGK